MNDKRKSQNILVAVLALMFLAVGAVVLAENVSGDENQEFVCTFIPITASYIGSEKSRPMSIKHIPDLGDTALCQRPPQVEQVVPPTPDPHAPFCVPTFDDDDPTELDEDWTCCEYDEIEDLWICTETKVENLPPGYIIQEGITQ